MNLKRAFSAVCAAAVLVSATLSDLPMQFSAYSHAYAAESLFGYSFDKSPISMTVKTKDDGSLECEYVVIFPVDGVTSGVTTVSELRGLYSGLTVSGFSFENSTVDGLTANDVHTSISILSGTDSGSYDGWYAVTDEDTLYFDDMPADNDDKVVQNLAYHIYLDSETISGLGMKTGDVLIINKSGSSDEDKESYYTHTEPGKPMQMTVTEPTWENASGRSCAYSSDFDIPGVTKGTTTVGELKKLYKGIKVEGYEFKGSTVKGMTAADLVPTIAIMTGDSWSWNAVYNTTTMNFSEALANVPDSDVVQSIAFSVSVQDDSFDKLGLKIGDSFVVNPTSELAQFVYKEPGKPLTLKVNEMTWDGGSSIVCEYSCDIEIPGVTKGTTTVGELKKLYSGIDVEGFSFRGASIDGLTEADLSPRIVFMTGSSWEWNAEFSTSMSFDVTLADIPDEDVVQYVAFSIQLNNGVIERLGLNVGDSFVINPNDYSISIEDGVITWDAEDGADHYEVCYNGGLLDNCLSNNSVGFKLAMALNGFKPGFYQLDIYAVYSDGTRKLLGSVEYEYGSESDVTENTFTCADNADGTVTITGGNIVTPRLEIPAEIEGKKVTAIGNMAFFTNGIITDLVIPEGVKSLDWYCFNTCLNLESVSLPDSLEFIDSWAFERCYNLKTINVPKNVRQINGGAFAQNDSLRSITCDSENRYYTSVNGVLFTKDMTALMAYPGGIQGGYTVPASVNHISDAAFYGAHGLDSVTILGNLDFIGFEAFAECSQLTDVAIRDGVNYVGYSAFRGCTGIKQLTVPQSVTNIGNEAFGYLDGTSKISGFSLRGYKDSAVYFYALRHDIPFICIGEASEDNKPFDRDNAKESEVETDPSKPADEAIKSITITTPFNMKDKSESGVGLDLSKATVKAKEIYDEEGIKRAEEALGMDIAANKKYNLLDLTFYNGDKDISNDYDGLVEVVIPIPKGHRDKTFYCYRLLDDGTKELIPGKQKEDSYVVYLEHFSVYAFVADDGHTCVFSEDWTNDKNGHWHECTCGKTTEVEAHTASEWITDIQPSSIENGHRYKACTVCGYILEEETITAEKTAVPVISPNGGTFVGSQKITITCATADADIYYTTDGTIPTTDSTKYTGAFPLNSSATVKAFAISATTTASDVVTAKFTKKSSSNGGSSGGSSGCSSGSSTVPSKPAVNGKEASWADIAAKISGLADKGGITINLNGNYAVPAEVMKAVADRKARVTFVIDSVKSWVIDGSQLTKTAAVDLTVIPARKLSTSVLPGVDGIQFTVSSAEIPAGIAVSFKAEHAGKFANLYKSIDGKLVFAGCAKLGSDGKVTVPGVSGKGDYAVMLDQFSDLAGDMNNDGVLNALDASAILKYSVGAENGANIQAADINGDGTVNALDAAEILKRVVS